MGNGTIGKNVLTVGEAALPLIKNAIAPETGKPIKPVEQPPAIHGGDSFAGTGVEKRADASQPTSPERALAEGGTPIRGEHAIELGTKTVAVEAGKSWSDVLGPHYGTPVNPGLIATIAELNGVSPTKPPHGVLTLYSTENIFRTMHPNDDRAFLDTAKFVTVSPGQSWEDFVRQYYGEDTPQLGVEGLAFILKRANHSAGELSNPLPVVAIPSSLDLTTFLARIVQKLQPSDAVAVTTASPTAFAEQKRPPTDRTLRMHREAGGEIYQPRPGETLRDAVIRKYHGELLNQGLSPEQASEKLADYMLLIYGVNNLGSTNLDGYEAIWLPPAERLDIRRQMERGTHRLQRWRSSDDPMVQVIVSQGRGALADALAFTEGRYQTSGPAQSVHTGAAAPLGVTTEKIEAALSIVKARYLADSRQQFPTIICYFCISVGDMIGAFEVARAEAAAKAKRGETESITDYVDRTTQHLSSEDRAVQMRVADKVAKQMALLWTYGLVDHQGFFIYEIDDPARIAMIIYEKTAETDIDYTVRAELINNLRGYAASRVGRDGMLTGRVDVAEAYREAWSEIELWSSADEGGGNWKDDVQTAFADQRIDIEPEGPIDDAIDQGSVARKEVDDLTGQLKVLVPNHTTDFSQLADDLRAELMERLRREAEALALLKRDVRKFDELIKFVGNQIANDLAKGRPVGGPAPESQVNK
ncbi:MAG: hypothetical protein V3T05_02460 [Myxococcota bacterium]